MQETVNLPFPGVFFSSAEAVFLVAATMAATVGGVTSEQIEEVS